MSKNKGLTFDGFSNRWFKDTSLRKLIGNMWKIQEDEGEEEECKLDLNDNETNPI